MVNTNYYNSHTHSFNGPCAPDGFLTCYVPTRFLQKLLPPLLRWAPSEKLVQFLLQFSDKYKRYRGFLRVASYKQQDEVFAEAFKALGSNSRIVVLPIDFDFMGGGNCPVNYRTQVAEMKEVLRKFPQNCLPFYCVDPRRGTDQQNLDLLKEYFDLQKPSGFVGIKLYPPLGFYPFDPRLVKVYEFAQEHKIPITSHCTTGGAFFVTNPMPAAMMDPVSFNPTAPVIEYHNSHPYSSSASNDKNTDKFTHPINYIDVLEAFPRLKLNIAHYGGNDMIKCYLKKNNQSIDDNWYLCIKALLKGDPVVLSSGETFHLTNYTNLYADISFTLYDDSKIKGNNNTVIDQIVNDIQDPALTNRILFGTDYFMTVQYKEEVDLISQFRNAVPAGLFDQVASTNPRSFLTSDFYSAP